MDETPMPRLYLITFNARNPAHPHVTAVTNNPHANSKGAIF